jgi:hypothetical protein
MSAYGVGEGDIRNCLGKLNDPGKPALRRPGILPQQLRTSRLSVAIDAAPPSSSVPPRLEGSPQMKASLLPRCPGTSFATRPNATPSGSVRCRYGRIFLNRPDPE